MSICKNVFKVNDVYDLVVAGTWINYNSSCDAGFLWQWGRNSIGQLGNNDTIDRSSPVQVPGNSWNRTSLGQQHTFAIKTDLSLWAWGLNQGTLGDNTVIPRSSPVQIPGNWMCMSGAGGFSHGIKTNNTLWAWGCGGTLGCLGDDSVSILRSSPIQIPGTQWSFIHSGCGHIVALKSDGSLWSWGYGGRGQLATPGTPGFPRSSPSQIPGNSWVEARAVGQHSLGRKNDGTLWSWGYNLYGRLGDNTSISKSSPVQIPGTQWNEIAGSTKFSLARKTDGTLWSWGYNSLCGLGLGNTIHRSSPSQIPGTSWSELKSSGVNGQHSLARKTDNTLWSWGYNSFGTLGDGTIIHRNSPVQIPGKWNNIDVGGQHSLGKKQP